PRALHARTDAIAVDRQRPQFSNHKAAERLRIFIEVGIKIVERIVPAFDIFLDEQIFIEYGDFVIDSQQLFARARDDALDPAAFIAAEAALDSRTTPRARARGLDDTRINDLATESIRAAWPIECE